MAKGGKILTLTLFHAKGRVTAVFALEHLSGWVRGERKNGCEVPEAKEKKEKVLVTAAVTPMQHVRYPHHGFVSNINGSAKQTDVHHDVLTHNMMLH